MDSARKTASFYPLAYFAEVRICCTNIPRTIVGYPGSVVYCSVATVSLRLAVVPGFGGYFGRKMAVFGPKRRIFGRAPPDLAPTPRAATGEFLAQDLDLARPPPRL